MEKCNISLMKNFFTRCFAVFFLTAISLSNLFSQTGPAGIGNADGTGGQPRNIMWLDASAISASDGDLIGAWLDQSGNGAHGSSSGANQPEYVASSPVINNQPLIRFFGEDADFIDLSANLSGAQDGIVGNDYNCILVAGRREMGLNYILSGDYFQDGNLYIGWRNSSTSFRYGHWSLNDIETNATISAGQLGIFTAEFNSSNAPNRRRIFENGILLGSSNSNTALSQWNNPKLAVLGNLIYADVDIAEVIFYQGALNDAQRIIIENYLGEKYGITLAGNDYYTNASGYSFFLSGIGNDSGDLSETGNSSGLYIENRNSSLNAGEFLLYAHNGTINSVVSSDISGSVEGRWARDWYFDKTSSNGIDAKIAFDFGDAISGSTPTNVSNYVLLYRSGTSGNYSIVSGLTNGLEAGDRVYFEIDDADLADGYYTLGTTNATNSPLLGSVPQTWYSYAPLTGSNSWDNPNTWTLDPSGTLLTGPAELPGPDDRVVILNGKNVNLNTTGKTVVSLEVRSGGVLDIDVSGANDFGLISGAGRIRLQDDNFPSGDASDFATKGTVEFYGASYDINSNYEFNNVIVNLDNPANTLTLQNDFTMNGDFTIENGIFRVNDTGTTEFDISVDGDFTIESNGQFLVGTGDAFHLLDLKGDFTNFGTAYFTNLTSSSYTSTPSNGVVEVQYSNNFDDQTTFLDGETRFYRIIIDKGVDDTYMAEFEATAESNFVLWGRNNFSGAGNGVSDVPHALGLNVGTVKLGNNINIPELKRGGGNYDINSGARIWVDNGKLSMSGNTALVVYGAFQVSGVDAEVNITSGSGLTLREYGSILIQEGTTTVAQIRTSIFGPQHVGSYTQTGGTVNVTGIGASTNYYTFSMTYPGNVFQMSGGTLHIFRADGANNDEGGIWINSDDENISVTGGTVIMDMDNGTDFKVMSKAPFYNVIMRNSNSTSEQEVRLSGGNVASQNVAAQPLVVLNDLTIEDYVLFDHEGENVTIGGDFTIATNSDYEYNNGKQNTTTFNGSGNSVLSFFNRTGGGRDEQRFWNFVINKSAEDTVTLQSGKSNVNGNNNNLLRVEGDHFKVLRGTLDQGVHSIRMYADTLVNYQTCTVFDPTASSDGDPNGENDILKLRDDGGPATIMVTTDTSRFGGIKLNSADEIITLISDLRIDYLEYRHGRMDLNVHNLTIDRLNVILNGSETRTDEDGGGNFSVEDMFITAGNASDGGLSLYVPANAENPGFIDMSGAANTTNNPTVFFFPLGTGTTGVDGTSQYTPANIRFLSGTDDGYVTVIPVTQKLATAGPYPLGNDIINRYWIVDYSGFTTVPKVERMWFRAVESDDPNGAPDGFPVAFVPGYVLENAPYSRTAEINGGDNSTSYIDFTDAENIRIFFWGNEGSGNPVGGFDLINAAYTAGDPSKFIGQPQIFYSINSSRTNWTNGSAWSLNRDGASAGDYPREGDIAILTRDNGGGGDPTGYGAGVFNINNGTGPIEIAKLIFDDFDPVNNNWISGCPRVIFDAGGNYRAYDSFFSSVEVTDRHIGGSTPNQSHGAVMEYRLNSSYTGIFPGGDFGDFNRYENALVIYGWDGGTGTAVLSSDATEYPMLWFQGGNLNNTIVQFPDVDVTVNGRANLNGDMRIRVNNNSASILTFRNDVQVGSGCCEEGIFEFDGNSTENQTVVIDGNLNFNSTNGGAIQLFNNSGSNSHKFIVKGNIDVPNTGVINFGNGSNSVVDLELQGASSNSFSNTGSVTLHRIIMNKGNNRSNVFSFNDNFSLTGSTNTATKAIEIQNGTLRFNDAAINVDLTTGGPSFAIPSSGSLQITQGTANVSGDDSGILLDGSIIVDGGILNMDDPVGNGNNFIEYSASNNAELQILDGSLIVGSQIRRNTASEAGALQFTLGDGGTGTPSVVVGKNAAPESSRGVFEIENNAGSSFTYLNGSLIVMNQKATAGIASLYLHPSTFNIATDATIQIGGADTQTGQTITMDVGIPLQNLLIDNTSGNNPVAQLQVESLVLEGDFEIGSGAEFDANNLDLTVNGDFTNNGTYTPGTNTTFFRGNDQLLTGSTTFYNWYLEPQNRVLLASSSDITVNETLNVISGQLEDGGNTIEVMDSVNIIGAHITTTTGAGGILMNGSSIQYLTGGGNIGRLDIDNANSVVLEGPLMITDGLNLSTGIFNIQSNALEIEQDATFTGSPFSASKMITTTGTTGDGGVIVTLPSGPSLTAIPVGVGNKYTPVSYQVINSNAPYTITTKPVDGSHPTIIPANGGDPTNVLQFYWYLRCTTPPSGLNMTARFVYDQVDVAGDEANYIPARLVGTSWERINDPTLVDESTNTFEYDGINLIDGDYTIGTDPAIPLTIPTYTSTGNGDWEDVSKWIRDDAIAVPVGGPTGAPVVVDHDITITTNSRSAYTTTINSGGKLFIGNTFGHFLGDVDGTGTLNIESGTLPAGNWDNFFTCGGGSIEYDGTGDYTISSIPSTYENLSFLGSGQRNLPAKNITVCGDMLIDGPDITSNSNEIIIIRGNVERISGSIDKLRLLFQGSGIRNVIGDFTNNNSINYFRAQQNTNVVISGNVEVNNVLFLFNTAKITTDATNTLTLLSSAGIGGGSSTAFVDGPLIIEGVAGRSLFFPIGKNGRYGPININNTLGFSGTQDWTAEYMNSSPTDAGYDNSNILPSAEPVVGVSNSEYWIVDGPTPGEANIQLRWDNNSVPVLSDATVSDLRVMEGDASAFLGWLNVGGGNFTGDASGGTVTSNNGGGSFGRVTFSTKVFTLGTMTANSPLPVELIAFTAKVEGSEVLLEWETASELNNDYFVVERSFDGENFESIGEVTGNGTTKQTSYYEYWDSRPSVGTNYYRLKQVDFDGSFEYSSIIEVKIESNVETQFDLTIYPNPTSTSNVKLKLFSDEPGLPVYLTITNLSGMVIKQSKLEGMIIEDQYALNVDLKSGIYLLRVQQGNYEITKRLVIY